MINRCSFESAQRSYDNRSDDFADDFDYPDTMICGECGEVVELDRQGVDVGTGKCAYCGNFCEAEPI